MVLFVRVCVKLCFIVIVRIVTGITLGAGSSRSPVPIPLSPKAWGAHSCAHEALLLVWTRGGLRLGKLHWVRGSGVHRLVISDKLSQKQQQQQYWT